MTHPRRPRLLRAMQITALVAGLLAICLYAATLWARKFFGALNFEQIVWHVANMGTLKTGGDARLAARSLRFALPTGAGLEMPLFQGMLAAGARCAGGLLAGRRV